MNMVKRIRWWLIAGGIAGVAAGGSILVLDRIDSIANANANNKAAAVPEPKAVMVTVDPVTLRALQRRAQVVGSLWGRDEVGITPKVEGRVMKIHHFVGDVVHPATCSWRSRNATINSRSTKPGGRWNLNSPS